MLHDRELKELRHLTPRQKGYLSKYSCMGCGRNLTTPGCGSFTPGIPLCTLKDRKDRRAAALADIKQETPWDAQYRDAINQILSVGAVETNQRTGKRVKAAPGVHFNIDLGKAFPLLSLRKIPIKLFLAEMLWFVSGSRNIEWLQKYTRIWDDFVEEDGQLYAPYGRRWREHFGRDQLQGVIDKLTEDPSSRQCVVSTWDPSGDGLNSKNNPRNIPCLPTWTPNIIGNRLNLTVTARSNDMILGCPHDVAGYAFLAYMLASVLDPERIPSKVDMSRLRSPRKAGNTVEPDNFLRIGTLSYTIAHAHIYEDHFDAATDLAVRENFDQELIMAPTVLRRDTEGVIAGDERLMDELVGRYWKILHDQYRPLAKIEGLKITV